MSEDDWGCVITLVALAAGGYWLWNKYEIVERKKIVPFEQLSGAPRALRPIGTIPVGTNDAGGVWTLDADSVKGDRRHRQGWVKITVPKPKGDGRYSQSLFMVDCDTGAQKQLSLVGYDSKGSITFSQDTPPEKASVSYNPPNTLGAMVADQLCQGGFDTPK